MVSEAGGPAPGECPPRKALQRAAAVLRNLQQEKVISLREWSRISFGDFMARHQKVTRDSLDTSAMLDRSNGLFEQFDETVSDAFLIGLYDEQQVPIRAQHPLLEELARLFDYMFEGGDGREDDAIREAQRIAHFRQITRLMRANSARALALRKAAIASQKLKSQAAARKKPSAHTISSKPSSQKAMRKAPRRSAVVAKRKKKQ